MKVIRRWIEDITSLFSGIPLVIYIHALMIVFAAQNLTFYFEPLYSNLKIPFLYWIVCAYFFVFIFILFKHDREKWFFYAAIILGVLILYLMAESDVKYIPGAPIRVNYWPITAFFLGFIAWPVLGLPFYLYSLGLSWKLVLALFSVIFAAVVMYKEYLLRRKKQLR